MDEPIADLRVSVVRFVDEYQPGIVECEFVDAEGTRHRFIAKVPYVSHESLWSDSEYPRPGLLRCRVCEVRRDASGRELVRIDTWDQAVTADERSEFVVFAEQLEVAT